MPTVNPNNKASNPWKAKASMRSRINCNQKKKIKCLQNSCQQKKRKNKILENRVKRLEKELEEQKLQNSKLLEQESRFSDKQVIIFISLTLFIHRSIGFRAISRVWQVLSPYIGMKKPPSHQTIINWFMKLAYIRLVSQPTRFNTDDFANKLRNYFLIIDETIAITNKKILAVVAVLKTHYKTKQHAPQLKDVQTLFIDIDISWKSEQIKIILYKIFKVFGMPSGFIRDGGSNLKKAISEIQDDKNELSAINDISHFCANAFKHKYEKNEIFQRFLKICGEISTNMKQTALGFLAPPKVRYKARFMNISKIVFWASKIISLADRTEKDSNKLPEKFKNISYKLMEHKTFIEKLANELSIANEIMSILKNRGLGHRTYQQCSKELRSIEDVNSIRIELTSWLNEHIDIVRKQGMENIGMPVTSDTIESLFSKIKGQQQNSYHRDLAREGLKLFAMTNTLTMDDIRKIISLPCKELQNFLSTINSSHRDRLDLLYKKKDFSCFENRENDKNGKILEPFLDSVIQDKGLKILNNKEQIIPKNEDQKKTKKAA